MPFNSFVNAFQTSPIQPSNVSYLAIELVSNNQNFPLEWAFQNPATTLPFSQFIQITGTGITGNTITLPNALYSSAVQSTIIYNQSDETVNILDYSGTPIGTCSDGIAYFVGNTDNQTEEGDWTFITLGAGTSSATAASLIDPTSNGYMPPESNSGGLGAFGAYLKLNYKVYTYTGVNFVGNASDRGTAVTWTGGSGNYTLPDSATVGNGFVSALQNRSTTGGVITINVAGADLLNGGTSIQLQVGESTFFVTDGNGEWYTLALSSNIQYAIQADSHSIAGSGGTITLSATDATYQIQIFTGTYGIAPYATVTVIFPAAIVQQYFISNQSTTNNLFVYLSGESNPNFQYTLYPGESITTFTDGVHLYLAPNMIANDTIYLPDGTVGTPALTFLNDQTTGLYRNPTGSALTISQAGVAVAQFTSANTSSFKQILVPTTTSPTTANYSFTGQTTSGIGYNTSTSSVNVIVGGTLSCRFQSNTIFPQLMINSPTQSYQQADINIYSISRAYRNGA